MPIRFRCKCGKGFKVADEYAGKRVKCPACGVAMVVPVPEPPSEPKTPRGGGELELEMDATRSPLADVGAASESESIVEATVVDEPDSNQPSSSFDLEAHIPEEASTEESVEVVSLAGQAQEEVDLGKTCPKCGLPVSEPDAVICTGCGAELAAAEAQGPSVPIPTQPPSRMKWVVIGATAAVVLVVVIVGIMMLSKKKPEEPAPTASNTAPRQSRPRAQQRPKPPPPKPVPKIVVDWEGFADPALRTRDRLLTLGEGLTAFHEENNRYPSSLADLGVVDTAGVEYVGRDAAGLERFHPLAYASQADSAGRVRVLFSDGTVRAVEEKDIDSVLLSRQDAGLMTKPDAELLSELGPRLRVSNPRFPELQVFLDDGVLGTVKREKTATFSVPEGSHRLAFGVKSRRSENLTLACDPGILYEYTYHRHQDLPAIAAYEYLEALRQGTQGRTSRSQRSGGRTSRTQTQGATTYQVVRDGNRITGVSGQNETVHFAGDERNAVSRDYRAVNGWIQREHLKIEGLSGKPIVVSEYSRLEEGVVRYTTGQEIIYHGTALGTVAVRQRPNIEVATLARFHEKQRPAPRPSLVTEPGPGTGPARSVPAGPSGRGGSQAQRPGPRGGPAGGLAARAANRAGPRSGGPGGGPGGGMSLMQRARMMQGTGPGVGPRLGAGPGVRPGAGPGAGPVADTGGTVVSLDIEIPDMVLSPGPDCQALAANLRQSASGITPLLLRQIDAVLAPQTTEQEDVRQRNRPPSSRSRIDARQRTAGGRARPGRPGGLGGTRAQPAAAMEQMEVTPLGQSKALERASIADLIATLAVHGDSSALMVLSRLAGEIDSNAAGYDELVIALARCGGGQALFQIDSAAENAPQEAAIALAMIDTSAARAALRDIIEGWSAADLKGAVEIWPDIAGVSARAVLMENLVAVRPALLEEAAALNALLKLDGYTLERILLQRLLDKSLPVAEKPDEEAEEPEEAPRGRSARSGSNRRPPPTRSSSAPSAVAASLAGRGRDTSLPVSWEILARLKNTKAIEHLVDLLNGDDIQKKRAAMAAVSKTGDESFLPIGIALLEDHDRLTREYAVRLLVGVGNREAVETLDKEMGAELLFAAIPDAASELVDKAGRDATVALLCKMLEISVADGSAASESAGSGSATLSMAGSDVATPEAILDALVDLRADSDLVRAAIEKARMSDDPAIRVAAYEAIAAFTSPPESKPRKGSMVRGMVKLATFGKLKGTTGRSGTGALDPAVMEGLQDPEPQVRVAAMALLKGQSAEEAASMLETRASDTDIETRRAVMETVGTLKGESLRVTQILSAGLSDSDAEVVVAAANAVTRREESGVGIVLEVAMNNPAGEELDRIRVLSALIEAAGKVGDRRIVQSLALLLGEGEAEIREAAAQALGDIGDDNAAFALRTMLDDPNPEVSTAGILALSRMQSPMAISLSLEALSSENLPIGVRSEILKRLVAESVKPGVYAEWLDRSGPLNETNLLALVGIASDQSPDLRAGFLHLAKRYLSSDQGNTRQYAAQIMAAYASDPEARSALLDAFEQDATGICEPVAAVLRKIDDPRMLASLWKLYLAINTPSATGRTGRPGLGGGAQTGLPGVGASEGRVLTLALIQAMSNMKSDQAAQMLGRIGRAEAHAGRSDVVVKVIEALPRTEAPMAVRYLAQVGAQVDLFGSRVAESLAEVGHLDPNEARVALLKIARSHVTRAAAVAADALEALEAAQSNGSSSSAGG